MRRLLRRAMKISPMTNNALSPQPVIVGMAAGTEVNWSAALITLVPPGVTTVTSTVPEPAGEVAVIDVAEIAITLVALAAPNLTAVAPVKLVPVMVTVVPPVAGPLVGLMLVTVGAAR